MMMDGKKKMMKMPSGMNCGETRLEQAGKMKGFKKPGSGAHSIKPSGKSRHRKV